MNWRTINRPGVFGKRKDRIIEDFDSSYGQGNWRITHAYDEKFLDFLEVCRLYEEAYFQDSLRRGGLWSSLRKEALNVYDIDWSDLGSGCDYLAQNNNGIHIQDIAIRNVFKRNRWCFLGTQFIQIRGGTNHFGNELTPGMVRFHQPEKIVTPRLNGWWDTDSVEDFYQSNKLLQVKE